MNINKKKLIDETNFWDIFAKVADIHDITIKTSNDFDFIPKKNMFISKKFYDPYYYENPEKHNNDEPGGPYFIIITFKNGEDKIDTIKATISIVEIYPFENYDEEFYIISQSTKFKMKYIADDNAWTSMDLFFDKLMYEDPKLYNELFTDPDAILNGE